MLNPDQKDHKDSLNKMKRTDLCPCGWFSEKECLTHCSTGTRADAAALVRRIKEIYAQIDRAKETPDDQ
jgi:hypothetical protein